MKKLTTVFAMLAALSLCNVAQAHPEHDDMPELELTLEKNKSTGGPVFFVVIDGRKLPTAGATGVFKVGSGARAREVELNPTGGNGMEPKSPAKLERGTKGRAIVTLADKTVVSSDFVIQ